MKKITRYMFKLLLQFAHAVSVLLVLLTGKYLVKIVQVSLGLSIKIAFKKAIKLQLL